MDVDTLIIIGRAPADEMCEIRIEKEGALYIASVMEQYQGHDHGGRLIAQEIRDALEDES